MPNLSQRKQRELKKEATRIRSLPHEAKLAALADAEIFVIESEWINIKTDDVRPGHFPMIGGLRLMHDLLLEPNPNQPDVVDAVRWKLFDSHEEALAAAQAIQAELLDKVKTAATV